MYKTQKEINTNSMLVDTQTLKNLLCCGRPTAVSIGCEAGAKVKINKRVLWNVELVRKHLNNIAE